VTISSICYKRLPVPCLVLPNPITVRILIMLGLLVSAFAAAIAALGGGGGRGGGEKRGRDSGIKFYILEIKYINKWIACRCEQ
jgi:hypothetical protein